MNFCPICAAQLTGNQCGQCKGHFEPTLTLRLLGYVQYRMFRVAQLRAPKFFQRLERAEAYLLERYNRQPAVDCAALYAEIGGEG